MSVEVITRQMGITHKDFFRLLPAAIGTSQYRVDETMVLCEIEGRRIEIDLGAEGERRIARLTIPATDVTIRLSGFDELEKTAFLIVFDRAYQRGGG